MKSFQLLIILMVVNSCSPIGKKTILYGTKYDRSCTQIELKENKSFEFYYYYGLGKPAIIKGRWKYAEGDTIRLNTYEQPYFKNAFFVKKKNLELSEKMRVHIRDYHNPLIGVGVLINGEEEVGVTDENGNFYFQVKDLKTISTHYIGYKQETVEIKDSTINDIKIYLSDSREEFFTDKLVVVKRKKLIMHAEDSERSYSLRRSRLKNKCWE